MNESKWISVNEKLPGIHETVLVSVLSTNGYGEPAAYETLGSYEKEWELYFPLHKGERVIYWMPLPEPPNQKEIEKAAQAAERITP